MLFRAGIEAKLEQAALISRQSLSSGVYLAGNQYLGRRRGYTVESAAYIRVAEARQLSSVAFIKVFCLCLQVYSVVDEMFLAGEIRETSQNRVLKQLLHLSALE